MKDICCIGHITKDKIITPRQTVYMAGGTSFYFSYAINHLPDNVSEEVKIQRLNELIKLQTEVSAEQNRKDEGKEFDVLVEGYSKRSRQQLMGRTEQNKAVVFDKGNHHVGETVRVKITGSTSATLFGTLVPSPSAAE